MPRLRAIASVNTGDNVINRVQDNLLNAVNAVRLAPLVGGTILKSVSLAIGDNTIQHGLGSTLTGWVLTRQRAATTVYDKQDTNTIPDKTLVLNSSAAAVVDLYVF